MRRTDLALEAKELWREKSASELPPGAEGETRTEGGCTLETLVVADPEAAKALGKPMGKYITITPEALLRREEGAFEEAAALLGRELRSLLDLRSGESVLVAGLGNEAITPDSLGPRTMRHVLATRHLVAALPETFGAFRRVAVLETGVLGNTGMESAEMVKAVAEKLRPDAVIAVDALASRRLGRICRTVQLTDTGIVPGSGVGNARRELSRSTLGVPVVGLGVPTVVDAATLAADLTELSGRGEARPEDFGEYGAGMMVTPREIDQQTAGMARLLGYGIDLALHDLSVGDVTALVG